MLLKTLEIHGFKSFADKTKLEFHEGVTGIVGPNGCGKSNIVDAMRWVLGETSAKALRGGEMVDVIFNGTDRRSPLGMAQVTLTLSGCSEALNTEYDEVAIGRRVYRDGKSEYLINQSPCRLKDVHELLMGTGIGRTSYSIMEQGKIDMLLSSRPEDRRAVFEEAAGITKFKNQKKEALRKLENTEANLVRIRDIIGEEERQIRSLSRQASKARRFQILSEEVRVLDLHYSHLKWRELHASHSELSVSSKNLRSEQNKLEAEIEEQQAAMASCRFEHQELESRLSELLGKISALDNEVDSARNRINFNRERTEEQEILIRKNEEDIEVTTSKLGQQKEELASATETQGAVEARIHELEEIVTKYEKQLGEARQNREALTLEIRDSEKERNSLKDVIANLTAQIATNSLQFDTDKQRLLDLTDEAGRLRREEEQRRNELAELRRRHKELHEAIAFDESEFNDMETRYRQAKSAALERLEDLSVLHKLNAEKSSRLDILEQLVAEGEGFAKGTQAVLKGNFAVPGLSADAIRKPLYSYIETEERYAAAIEAALGNQLQTVVVEGVEVAEKVIAALKREMLGKASLIAADHLVAGSPVTRKSAPPKGALCWAIDVVNPAPEVESLMKRLLDNVLIAEELHSALELRERAPAKAIATLNGEFISKEGVIYGGASNEEEGSLLKRQSEIRDLSRVTSSLETEVKKMQFRRDELNQRVSKLDQALEGARLKLREKKAAASTLENKRNQAERELSGLSKKIESIAWEHEQIENRGSTMELSMGANRETLDLSNSSIATLDQKIERAISRHEQFRSREEELNSLAVEARTGLAVEKSTRENLKNQKRPMSNRLSELEDLIQRRKEESDIFKQRIVKSRQEIVDLTQQIQGKETGRQTMAADLAVLMEQRGGFLKKIEGAETNLGEKRRRIQQMAEKRNSEELQVSQCEIHLENLQNNVRERYHAELEFFEPDSHLLLSVIAQQKAKLRHQSEENPGETEIASSAAAIENEVADFRDPGEPDWSFVEKIVSDLRAKLDAMGPVNLDSIEEYEELEERYQFNLRELNDLENAKKELLNLIARINKDTRKMFAETFEMVRANFREMFKELFGEKAKADLTLNENEDPLEAGIDVFAKPPGKKLQNISLLSGGERSMTAVALLFAIFMVKPSPFCVLDELDAPLDEANISRFIRVLDRFIGRSQFVIVTHSKRTMSRADVMYGVSMEEFGVSKTVGVRFSKADEAVGLKEAPIGG